MDRREKFFVKNREVGNNVKFKYFGTLKRYIN